MNILITGASGGIGRALALQYANGDDVLFLLGRNQERLTQTAEHCQQRGAKVQFLLADLCDVDYESNIQHLSQAHDFDLVIANAGINLLESFADVNEHSSEQISQLMRINFEGQIKTIFPLLKGLSKNKGHVVVISSMVAFRGLPQDPAYCASKAALSAFFEGCRATWSRQNVGVTLVYPGFVKTPMSDKITGAKPFCINPEKAAKIIHKNIQRRKPRIIFPWPLRLLLNLHKLAPTRLVDKILSGF